MPTVENLSTIGSALKLTDEAKPAGTRPAGAEQSHRLDEPTKTVLRTLSRIPTEQDRFELFGGEESGLRAGSAWRRARVVKASLVECLDYTGDDSVGCELD